ncbi:glycosyltransferase family 2 protein [Devosia sp.]|uniref:glycosyltransferase family 2 protein n=1 Tax=Devosia sp. TaxID=1871048 RepID=UPI002AFE8558|nr:glycosyltransferase family 2 protein [Devosia sp.]
MTKLSVVATLYRSAAYIEEFCQRSAMAARSFAEDDFEIVLVNDGSPDDSLTRASQLAAQDDHIVVVDLSRNHGHHKAMMTGLSHARGDFVFLIDSDLEEQPEWLQSFAEIMANEGCDVVYGVQKSRKGGIFERASGALFYRLLRGISDIEVPANMTVARLMTRRYVRALTRHREAELFMAGLWVATGFEQRPHLVRKESLSPTTYTLRKKISQLVNSVTSFSTAPLKLIFFSGCWIFGASALFSAYLVLNWLFMSRPPGGYTSLMVSVWLLGGLIIAFLGVIGMYLAKIYSETKGRPYSIVRGIFRNGAWQDDSGGEA